MPPVRSDPDTRSAGRRPPGHGLWSRAISAAPFATCNPNRAARAMPIRYENATNVSKNATDTIHMSGLTSRQWPCVTFTTT